MTLFSIFFIEFLNFAIMVLGLSRIFILIILFSLEFLLFCIGGFPQKSGSTFILKRILKGLIEAVCVFERRREIDTVWFLCVSRECLLIEDLTMGRPGSELSFSLGESNASTSFLQRIYFQSLAWG